MSHEGELTVPSAPRLGPVDLVEEIVYYPPNPDGHQEDFPMGSPTGCDTPQSNPDTPTPSKHSTLFDGAEGSSDSAFNTPAKRSNQDAEMLQDHRSPGKIPKLEGRISSTSRGKGKERAIYTMEEASMSDDAVLDRMGLSLAGFDKGSNVGESDDCKHRGEGFAMPVLLGPPELLFRRT